MTLLEQATETTATPDAFTANLLLVSVGGTGLAVVMASIMFGIATAIHGGLVITGEPATEITIANVIVFTILGGLLAAALATLAGRFAPRPRLTFLVVCATGLAGYAFVPFAAAATVATAIWLNALHLTVAVPVVGLWARSLPPEKA